MYMAGSPTHTSTHGQLAPISLLIFYVNKSSIQIL